MRRDPTKIYPLATGTRDLLAFLTLRGRPVRFRSTGGEQWTTRRFRDGSQHLCTSCVIRSAVRAGYTTASPQVLRDGRRQERTIGLTTKGREALRQRLRI